MSARNTLANKALRRVEREKRRAGERPLVREVIRFDRHGNPRPPRAPGNTSPVGRVRLARMNRR